MTWEDYATKLRLHFENAASAAGSSLDAIDINMNQINITNTLYREIKQDRSIYIRFADHNLGQIVFYISDDNFSPNLDCLNLDIVCEDTSFQLLWKIRSAWLDTGANSDEIENLCTTGSQ